MERSRRFARSLLVLAALALPVAGCNRGTPLERAEKALAASGLKVEPFQTVPPDRLAANACRGGKVEGLDVAVCAYNSPDGRDSAEKAAEGWIGTAVTGTWAGRDDSGSGDGRYLLLVVADRDRADLNGRNVKKLVSAFSPKKTR